jgi:hypothetical protein
MATFHPFQKQRNAVNDAELIMIEGDIKIKEDKRRRGTGGGKEGERGGGGEKEEEEKKASLHLFKSTMCLLMLTRG